MCLQIFFIILNSFLKENKSTLREESESDSESDDEEKGRGRFKSERVTISTISATKARTDIPDTLGLFTILLVAF